MLLNGCAMLPGNILIRSCIGNMVFFHSDLDGKSRMTGDCHVRFCERFRGETPLYLLDYIFQSVFYVFICKALKLIIIFLVVSYHVAEQFLIWVIVIDTCQT